MEKIEVKVGESYVSFYEFGDDSSKQPPIILLHGTNSNGGGSYASLSKELSKTRKIYIVDYAGCGDSSFPDDDPTIEGLAKQIFAIIQYCNLEKVDLAGHSLGAVVASVVAILYPEYIHKLVLSSPWSNSSDPRHQFIFKTWKHLEQTDPKISMAFALTHIFSPSFLSHLKEDFIEDICTSPSMHDTDKRIEVGLHVDLNEKLKSITAQTLVIAFTKDHLVPPYMVQEVYEHIDNSQYSEIPCGHAVQFENPKLWASEVLEFLE